MGIKKNTSLDKNIFREYFRTWLFFGLGIGVVATSIRYFRGFEATTPFALGFILFITTVGFFVGLINYYFYEKTAPKIVSKLLDNSPLKEFQNNGFLKKEENKLEGQIYNFKVILAPLTNIQRENYLTVLIPLQLKEGLEKYFLKYNENFKLCFSGEVLFAQAILKRYDKQYDYNKLHDLLNATTTQLQGEEIAPLKIEKETPMTRN